MKISFQNFYAFEFTIGLTGIMAGFYFLQYSLFFILLIIGSCGFVFNSITRWNKSQRNKETLEGLEVERQNAHLDFDITKIESETDIDWYPDDVVNGEPVGFNEMYTVTYIIKLVVYNSCIIENVIRNIEVTVKNRNKDVDTKNCSSSKDKNKFPVSILPRKYLNVEFLAFANDIKGNKGDILQITVISIDGKKTSKEYEIKYYQLGETLREVLPKA